MSRFFFMTVLISLLCEACYGQAPLIESGSVEAHRQRVRIEQQRIEEQIRKREWLSEWKKAKKLTLLHELPTSPHEREKCMPPENLEDNSIGYLDYWRVEIIGVEGPEDVLLTLRDEDTPAVWLTGYKTNGLVDGEQVRLIGPVLVKGTKTYETVDGASATVRVIRLLTPEETKKIEDEKAAATEAALYRTWTDATGTHKVLAKFIDFKKGKAYLQRKDSQTIELSPSKLSKEDQEWIREEMKKRKEQEKILKN